MTKKEFEFWKEHKQDLLTAKSIEVLLYQFTNIKEIDIALDSHNRTPEPTLREHIHCTKYFSTANYEIIDVAFEGDTFIISTRRKHKYTDKDDRTKKCVLVGPILIYSFHRMYIKSIIWYRESTICMENKDSN